MKIPKFVFLVLIFFCNYSLFAQYTEVINSNRPGMSRSAFSVGTNVLQFEIGPTYIKEEHTPLNFEVSGFGVDFAARYGLFFEQLELNIEGNYQNDTFTDNRSSISDSRKRSNFRFLTVGAKYLVYDPYKDAESNKPNLYSWKANHSFQWKSLIPAVAVYVGANYDTETNPYTALGIGTNQSDFSYVLTLTHSFSPQWVVFGEIQGLKSDFYADNLLRFGGAYLWNKNFQLDTAATFNTKDTPSVFNLTFGASYRFDFHKDPNKDIDNGNSAEEELERKLRSKGTKKKKKRKKNGDTVETKEKKRKRKDEDFDK